MIFDWPNLDGLKEKGALYGIGFAADDVGAKQLKYVVADEDNFYNADDLDTLHESFDSVTDKILAVDDAVLNDPMSEYVECTGVTSTEVSGANGVDYPEADYNEKTNSVTWSMDADQTLAPGQTLTIKYNVKLKKETLASLYEKNGTIPLNGDAILTYSVEGEGANSLSFPVPEDKLEISKLTTTNYLDGNPQQPSTDTYTLVSSGAEMELTLPETGDIISDNGVNYIYSDSTYDSNAVPAGNRVPVEAGEHFLNHYYYSQNKMCNLVYNANGGTFADGSESQTVAGLFPGNYQLWTKDGQGQVPDGQDSWPTHADDNDRPVVMLGWTTDSSAENKVYDKDATLPMIATTYRLDMYINTIYAVWGYDDNDDGIADATQLIITPEDQTIYTGGEGGAGEGNNFPHPIYLVDGDELPGDVSFMVDGQPWDKLQGDYPFTVKYYDSNDQEITDDETYGDYTAKIVPTVDGTITISDGKTVTFEPGALRIRYVSDATAASGNELTSNAVTYAANDVDAKAEARATVEENGEAGVILPADTTIYLNGKVEYPYPAIGENNPYQIALLFDDLLPRVGDTAADFADVLLEHAADQNHDVAGKESEVKYLDLVDVNDSNAWVSSSAGSDVFWPYPSGTDKDTEFTLLHFNDLHREYDMTGEADLNAQIAASKVDEVTIEQTEEGIWFHVDANGFSPFALVWTKADEPAPVEKHDVIFNAGAHGSFNGSDADVTVQIDENSNLTNSQIPNVTADRNWKFVGWKGSDGKTYTNAQLLELSITEDMTFTAQYESTYTPPPYDPGEPDPEPDDPEPDEPNTPDDLNTVDHFSYIVGYEDGTVMPQKQITRAEVATIFYRLLKEDVRDENTTDVSNFSDVKSSDWYGTTVATLADMGIVKGYEDGTFRPNASITCAEFAAIATRFFDETGATYEPGTFTDVTGDEWFAGAIMDAVNLGLIGGYEDGTVRPNNNITRAEACAIVNRTLGRVPDADHLLPEDEMKTWPDNPESAWFYADMQEATNGHEYEWITDDGNKVENWTDLLDKDWNDR